MAMLKGRKITLTLEKPEGGTETVDLDLGKTSFDDKLVKALPHLERIGKQVFLGICIYVVLDTRRKVAIAKASRPRG